MVTNTEFKIFLVWLSIVIVLYTFSKCQWALSRTNYNWKYWRENTFPGFVAIGLFYAGSGIGVLFLFVKLMMGIF